MSTRLFVHKRFGNEQGLTLIELVIAIVVIGVGVAGVLAAFTMAVRGSADPLQAKQALAVAEALLEEVQLAPFTYCDPDDPNAGTATSAAGCSVPEDTGPEAGDSRPFDNVSDYDGLTLNPITDVSGSPVTGLTGYSARIAVVPATLNGIAAAEALQITVSVSTPTGSVYTLQGYRTRYAPNAIP